MTSRSGHQSNCHWLYFMSKNTLYDDVKVTGFLIFWLFALHLSFHVVWFFGVCSHASTAGYSATVPIRNWRRHREQGGNKHTQSIYIVNAYDGYRHAYSRLITFSTLTTFYSDENRGLKKVTAICIYGWVSFVFGRRVRLTKRFQKGVRRVKEVV